MRGYRARGYRARGYRVRDYRRARVHPLTSQQIDFSESLLALMKHWIEKFGNAFRGLVSGVSGQSSFAVHGLASVLVVAFAILLRCSPVQWIVLLLCITLVWATEMMNSALEHFAKGVSPKQNAEVGKALDIASAAVLLASLGAALIGTIVFATQLLKL